MNTLERCQWHRSSVFIVDCEHISNFLLIIDLEQAKVCRVHFEKINTFENEIRCIMRQVVVIKVQPKFINKYHWKLYYHNPMGESGGNFCQGVLLQTLILAKRKCGSHSKWPAAHSSFYQLFFIDFARWKTNYTTDFKLLNYHC